MGFWNRTKKVVKPLVNVPAWVGYDRLASSTRSIWDVIKGLFFPAKAEREETFEQAMERLNLTEEVLKQRVKEFHNLIFMWAVIFCGVVGYAIYLAWQGSWIGFIPAIAISLIPIAQMFRYHFWVFQIKQRKLGCTFKEWLNSSFTG